VIGTAVSMIAIEKQVAKWIKTLCQVLSVMPSRRPYGAKASDYGQDIKSVQCEDSTKLAYGPPVYVVARIMGQLSDLPSWRFGQGGYGRIY